MTGWISVEGVEIPEWLGGLPRDEGGSYFGGEELLLTGIAVGIIFAILLPRWLKRRRTR
jgi:hypothetical protein